MASQPGSSRQFLNERVEELGLVLAGFFAIVVIVAGASALALLTWPSHSGTDFSWDLGEPPAAALIGGLYLASVIVFAEAAIRPRHETRALTLGILGLAVPTLVFTAVQHKVFDWSRPQAVAWVILFCSAPVSIALDLRTPTGRDTSPQMSAVPKVVVVATALASACLAGGLWVESSRARPPTPAPSRSPDSPPTISERGRHSSQSLPPLPCCEAGPAIPEASASLSDPCRSVQPSQRPEPAPTSTPTRPST